MQASISSDTPSRSSETAPRLNVEKVDELMSAKGHFTPAEQAQALGMNVTQWYDIRSGRTPNVTLKTAQKIAAVAGTTVDSLWGRS